MSVTPEPAHLSNHHRNTLRQIFQHPVSHNIEWHAVVSLLEAVGSVVEHRDGKAAVTIGSSTEFFDVPAHKDIGTQTVLDLRQMLSNAGYTPEAGSEQPLTRPGYPGAAFGPGRPSPRYPEVAFIRCPARVQACTPSSLSTRPKHCSAAPRTGPSSRSRAGTSGGGGSVRNAISPSW